MNKEVIIIAEAGVNHNGDISKAKKLIDIAAESGADYIKFQTFKADNIVSKTAKKANYQILNSNNSETQYEMLKRLELSEKDHQKLIKYCKQKKIKFFSTAFDCEGLDYLNKLGFEFFKIPSGEITNYPYLKKLALIGKPVILSTGMANMIEIKDAINLLTSQKLTIGDITVLHCNTEYPTPMTDVNLKAMISIRENFNVNIGYSDHTLGFEVSIAAVALGARVIEKHFTINRKLQGPDHASSLEPKELFQMVQCIRNVEKSISGNGIKKPSDSEIKNISSVRKSLHYKENFYAGHIIQSEDLISLRPGSGVSPMQIEKYIGKELNQNVKSLTIINNTQFI